MITINHGDDSISSLIIYFRKLKELGKNHLIFFKFMFRVYRLVIESVIVVLYHRLLALTLE